MLYLCMHMTDYMFELIVSYRLVHYSYIAISNWFELTTCFLTFYCDPSFLSQIQFLLDLFCLLFIEY